MNTLPNHIIDYCNQHAYQSGIRYKKRAKSFRNLREQDNMIYYSYCPHEWEDRSMGNHPNLYGCKKCPYQLTYHEYTP